MYPSMSPNWLFCIVGKLQTLNTENSSWNLFGIVFPRNFSFSLKKSAQTFCPFPSMLHDGICPQYIPLEALRRATFLLTEDTEYIQTKSLQFLNPKHDLVHQISSNVWLLPGSSNPTTAAVVSMVGSTLSICAPLPPDAQALQLIMIATKCTKGAILMHCFFTTPPPLHCSSAIVKYQMWNRK